MTILKLYQGALATFFTFFFKPNRRIPPHGDSHTMYAARLAKEFSNTSGGDKAKEHQSLVKILVDYGGK